MTDLNDHPSADPAERFEALDAGPVFIVGQARSGTTWVLEIMRAHPLVAGVMESRVFERTLGLAGLLSPSHWTETTGIGKLISREDTVREVRRVASTILGGAIKPHHRFLAEKTPGLVATVPIIAEVFPEARFVLVTRDGRDVAVSVREARKSWASSWRAGPGPVGIARTARSWRDAWHSGREQLATFSDRMIEVRYEELRADPFGGYRRLFDFCGFPYDDNVLNRIHEKTDFDTTGRAKDKTGFYRAGRVGDWSFSFNPVDAIAFNLVAGKTLVEAGYESSRFWMPGGSAKRADKARRTA